MPSYISHTIMARDVYKKLKNNNVDLNYMLTYSLGGDLLKFSKCRYESHKKSKELFFKNMITYIKNNSLEDDSEILGVLYGHICHYALDDTMHPLVRKMAKECKPNKKNHGFIESYYDIYLVKEKYNEEINKYDNKALFKGKITKKISKMLDYSYDKTYNIKHLSRYYKLNIFLYKKIRYLYMIFNIKTIQNLTGYTNFININKNIDLLNNNNEIEYRNINNETRKDSFNNLYEESIRIALKEIEKI